MKKLFIIALIALQYACQKSDQKITNSADYNKYLSLDSQNETLVLAKTELKFWSDKFEKAPNQYPYLVKMAASNAQIFEQTSDINHLNEAINQYEKAIEMSNGTSASIYRSAARNYITHHMFREAFNCLSKADSLSEGKVATQKMLFDVNMELGNYDQAKENLQYISNEKDFDYLIRQAKWLDYEGHLEQAIANLELAAVEANNSKNSDLKLWIYSNLADFYGHNGQLEEAHQHYLKTLEIDPHYSYALKGIAWIAFSHEKDTEEAKKIINYIESIHPAPDYKLLRAEIAEFEGDQTLAKKLTDEYIQQVSMAAYGDMYNAYLVDLQPQKALSLAEKEVNNRPTPQSFALLAKAYLIVGEKEKAFEIINQNVLHKTFEPKSLLIAAEVLKENNKTIDELKKELLAANFEIGPTMAQKVNAL